MRVHLQHDLRAEIFSKLLIDIGDGKIKEMEGRINIPESLGNIVGDLIILTERIYPNIHQIGINCLSWLKERAILTPTNDSANNINNFLLNKLTTKHAKYESVDSVMAAEDAVHYTVKFLNILNPPGILPHFLNLKIGAPIMLLRNFNPPKLCSGPKLQVKNLHNNVIEATILTGKYEGEVVFIPRIPLIPSDYHFEFKHIQYPVTVCYAMTINKVQGQTLKMAGIDLRNDCFSHATIYYGIDKQYRTLVCSTTSPSKAWIILKEQFEPVSRASVTRLLDEFLSIKFNPDTESIAEFIARIRKMVERLKDVGHPLNDMYCAFQAIRTLSPEFQGIVQILYHWPDEDFKLDKIEIESIAEENRLKQLKNYLSKLEFTDNSVSAYATSKFKQQNVSENFKPKQDGNKSKFKKS
ncbi:ATP-dependent DNA helicase [Trichonephila clavipes]|nr:ATP-dependent DNA helicase [Trichonephila clavipes]